MTSSENGIRFERWIARLYDELGRLAVRHDVTIPTKTSKGKVRSQFDVTYGFPLTHYAECKYHDERSRIVTFEQVSTFVAKLDLIGAWPFQGEMVTNTGYERRAQAYAKGAGITLIDHDELVRMDWRRAHALRSILQGPSVEFARTLEERIRSYRR
jgi:hypothetical protein